MNNFINKNKIYVFLCLFSMYGFLFFNIGDRFTDYITTEKGEKKISSFERFLKNKLEEKQSASDLEKENFEYVKEIEKKLLKNPKYKYMSIFLVLALLSVLFIGIIFLIIFLIFKFSNKKIINLNKSKFSYYLKFGFRDLIKFLIIYIFLESVLKFLILGIFLFCLYFFSFGSDDLLGLNIFLTAVFMNILPAVFLINYIKKKYNQSIKYLGIDLKDTFKRIVFGIFSYIAFLPILFGVILISFIITAYFKVETLPHPIVPIMLEEKSILNMIFFIFFASILGPVTEEIFFRGIIYNLFRKRIGIVLSSILSSLFFASLHMDIAIIGVVFIMGVFLAYLYEESGSLLPSITVHVFHNTVMMIVLLIVKQFIP